jgi:hypothetical protein
MSGNASVVSYQTWNHCYQCAARADVIRYDTFYKLVECRECGETTYIPKRCAGTFDEFKEFVTSKLKEKTAHQTTGSDREA